MMAAIPVPHPLLEKYFEEQFNKNRVQIKVGLKVGPQTVTTDNVGESLIIADLQEISCSYRVHNE